MLDDFLDLLGNFIREPSVTGAEDSFFRVLTRERQELDELGGKCAALGITYTYKDAYVDALNETRIKKLSLGRTELGRLIAASNGEISGTTLQIPTTGYHTASETASLDSIRARFYY
jgi:hypothetical protein